MALSFARTSGPALKRPLSMLVMVPRAVPASFARADCPQPFASLAFRTVAPYSAHSARG